MTMPQLTSNTGIATVSTELTCPPVAAENTRPATAIIGARMPIRKSRVRKFCTLVISDVLRVTRLAVPNLSSSAAEKLCTFSKTCPRSAAEKSVEMRDAIFTDIKLTTQASTVTPAITAARVNTVPREESATPLLIIWASREGSIISATAANKTSTDSSAICRPFNFTLEKTVLIKYPFLRQPV